MADSTYVWSSGAPASIDDAVDQLRDASGNGNHLATAAGTGSATMKTNGVLFEHGDGALGHGYGISGAFASAMSVGWDILVAHKPVAEAENFNRTLWHGEAANNPQTILTAGNGTRKAFIGLTLTGTAVGATPAMEVLETRGGAASSQLYVNGSANGSAGGAATKAISTDGVTIGASNANGYGYQGTIAEVLFYDFELTAAERTHVTNWLRYRHGAGDSPY